ncbi:hypothetical protein B0O99DRAFT_619970 [Bisporella sp. PMI_857]|nr:hypothetical protein B0O99DRAFT_619970 [Bisporella sp. PMI_857]
MLTGTDASHYMHRFEEKKEYCMSLGLEHFHRVSTAGTRGRQYSLLVCNLSDEETNLAWALSAYHKSQQRAHRAQGINPDMFNDVRFVSEEAWGPNSGFLWSKGAKPWDFDEINNGHRDWGYVFWDKWRLKGWGVLKMNRRTWRRQGLEGRSMSR